MARCRRKTQPFGSLSSGDSWSAPEDSCGSDEMLDDNADEGGDDKALFDALDMPLCQVLNETYKTARTSSTSKWVEKTLTRREHWANCRKNVCCESITTRKHRINGFLIIINCILSVLISSTCNEEDYSRGEVRASVEVLLLWRRNT